MDHLTRLVGIGMPVSGEQVAALRAFLVLESDQAGWLTKRLVEAGRVEGYGELVYAAFVTAVRRRFSPAWTVSEVIRFVAATRAELLQDDIEVDPRTAEILVGRALGDGIATELDEKSRARAQILLLREMVVDAGLDDAGLDAFLAQARSLADQMTT
jgi:hypothetical protein